ncbi:MAG: carbonic anhydrase [Planctomycetaceae bacterium]
MNRIDVFESSFPFNTERVRAAAIYCSDGRLGEQFDEFLHMYLELPRYDRLAIPGGAASLASHFVTFRETEGLLEQLRFLIDVHKLEQIVLIAHEGCAFYSDRLKVSPLQLESQQQIDMRKALQRVRAISKRVQIHGFFARLTHNGKVRFEPVQL